MIKVDAKMLVHEFDYYAYTGEDRYHQPTYGSKQTITKCRIDYISQFSKNSREESTNLYAIIFCYADFTSPLPTFVEKSKVTIDGEDLIIERVLPMAQPFSGDLFAYELEVIQ